MALTLQSALAGGRYPDLGGRGYPELSIGGHSSSSLAEGGDGRGCRDGQEVPMDLSRRRSPSPDVSITTGRNALLDRAMGPPPPPPGAIDDTEAYDLRLGRPSHSIIPFHKLRKHAQKGPRARLKRQRLEKAVSLLGEREAAGEKSSCEEMTDVPVTEKTTLQMEDCEQPPPPAQLMQQMLMMQQTDSVAYPSLFYLQYCAMVQSLQLQQALQRRQATKLPAPSPAAVWRPDSASSSSSTAGTPPATPSTPGTPSTADEPPQRRRAPRTLTGKHVRQGQGASPETLRTLRRVILEKARLRGLGLLPAPKPRPKGRRKK